MKCSQCQAELPASATICPQCGTSNQQGQPVTFSYLPAGAPPWPTSVPAKLPYAVETDSAAPAGLSTSDQAVKKPKRSLRSVVLAVAILVLVPILGSAFTLTNLYLNGDLFANRPKAAAKVVTGQAQPTPGVQQTPSTAQGNQLPSPSSFKKTSNSDVNVSLQYPSDWQIQPTSGANSHAIDVSPSQQIPLEMVIVRYSDAFSAKVTSADEMNQGRISAVGSQQGATNVQVVQTGSPQPTIGGAQWAESEVTYMDGNGNKVHLASISVQHKKTYYNILILSMDEIYSEAMQKYIQPILNSVAFLS
jgi:hypothetical protein